MLLDGVENIVCVITDILVTFYDKQDNDFIKVYIFISNDLPKMLQLIFIIKLIYIFQYVIYYNPA